MPFEPKTYGGVGGRMYSGTPGVICSDVNWGFRFGGTQKTSVRLANDQLVIVRPNPNKIVRFDH